MRDSVRHRINGPATMPNADLKGLLFDKDGTLFDFHASWSAVVDRTLGMLSRSAAEADGMATSVGYDRHAGRFAPGAIIVAGSIAEIADAWVQFRSDLGTTEIERIANEIVNDAVAEGALVPAVPDLRGLLDRLRADGFVLGVGTHDSEAAALDQLGRSGVLDRFAFIAGYDSGHGLKPGPGMMLGFCAATGLKPENCAMIGDSVHDLGVAPASGAALAVGVLTGPAEHADLAPLADHVIDSIGDLPDLLARMK